MIFLQHKNNLWLHSFAIHVKQFIFHKVITQLQYKLKRLKCTRYRKDGTYVTQKFILFIWVEGRVLAFQKSAIRMQPEVLYLPVLSYFA